MIYVDLIDGKLAIDWERFDKDRVKDSNLSHTLKFTHQAISLLDGSPDEKMQQLENLALHIPLVTYDYLEKDGKYCCCAFWQYRTAYGLADTQDESRTLAQIDLLSILCDYPIDTLRIDESWIEFEFHNNQKTF